MSEIRRIPVRVRRWDDDLASAEAERSSAADNGRRPGPHRPSHGNGAQGRTIGATFGTDESAPAAAQLEEAVEATPAAAEGNEIDWQDRALRLQAEMENYRRRQRRLAQDEIESERERLLTAFLEVVDDLERALGSPSQDGSGLREGVELTHRAALQRLKKENVERIEAQGRRFDPSWHEAVSSVPGRPLGVAPETVVQVLEPGYRLGDRLLRPARVVVAV
jgi:molecular chaperone GrpE